ncbi:unnamed protein product, partial [Polarella glacialis]
SAAGAPQFRGGALGLSRGDSRLGKRVCGILSSSAASGPSCYRAPEASLQDVPEPSEQQLRMLGFASALPFIGFGFLDNFLMICLGDLIDGTLC